MFTDVIPKTKFNLKITINIYIEVSIQKERGKMSVLRGDRIMGFTFGTKKTLKPQDHFLKNYKENQIKALEKITQQQLEADLKLKQKKDSKKTQNKLFHEQDIIKMDKEVNKKKQNFADLHGGKKTENGNIFGAPTKHNTLYDKFKYNAAYDSGNYTHQFKNDQKLSQKEQIQQNKNMEHYIQDKVPHGIYYQPLQTNYNKYLGRLRKQ